MKKKVKKQKSKKSNNKRSFFFYCPFGHCLMHWSDSKPGKRCLRQHKLIKPERVS